MKRFLPTALLLLVVCGLAGRPAAAQEFVYYRNPDTHREVDKPYLGKIKSESAGGVTITIGKTDQFVPVLEVIQVGYSTAKKTPAEFRGMYGKIDSAMKLDPKSKARRDKLIEALNGFTEMIPDLADQPSAARYAQYRIAQIQYLMALDDGQPGQAIKALEDYASANPGGWEIVPTLMTLARLHEEAKDIPKAMVALGKLADLPDAPKEIARAGNVAVSQMLMRDKQYPAAEDRLKKLLDSLPPGDPLRAQTQVYLVQCQVAQKKTDGAEKMLTDAIRSSTEQQTQLRGIAYNALGDFYREKGQTEDAFWAYLRVDVQYNSDKNEHAKALYWLSKLYGEKKFGDRTGDPVRAKNCRERLMDKNFADTEYQKIAEKQP